jgi:hypothetical protein
MAVDWGEVTAIATSLLAIGLLGGTGAAVFAAQQVREARRSREAQMAAEFFRRWNEDALVETRRMVREFKSPDELCELIKLLLGRTLIERWEMWRPAIHRAHGPGTYPMFESLAEKLRHVLEHAAAPAQL